MPGSALPYRLWMTGELYVKVSDCPDTFNGIQTKHGFSRVTICHMKALISEHSLGSVFLNPNWVFPWKRICLVVKYCSLSLLANVDLIVSQLSYDFFAHLFSLLLEAEPELYCQWRLWNQQKHFSLPLSLLSTQSPNLSIFFPSFAWFVCFCRLLFLLLL